MVELRTDYKDDVLDSSMKGKRRYNIIENEDGTVCLEDVTEYSIIGSDYGAEDINEQNKAINKSDSSISSMRSALQSTQMQVSDVQANVTLLNNQIIVNNNLALGSIPRFGTQDIGLGLITDALHVSLSSAYDSANGCGYVYAGGTSDLPYDCSHGVRDVIYYNNNSVIIRITGINTLGYPDMWLNHYNGSGWVGWSNSAWVDVALSSEYLPSNSLVARKKNGVVELKCNANITKEIPTLNTFTKLGSLPIGMRPSVDIFKRIIDSHNIVYNIYINANGDILVGYGFDIRNNVDVDIRASTNLALHETFLA